MTAVRHVIILMDPTRAHVTAASRGMDEPVEVQAFEQILNTINDSSVKYFDKLGWLPVGDIMRTRKLLILHKVSQDHRPDYFTSYFKHVRSSHDHSTRSAAHNTRSATTLLKKLRT